MLKVGHANEVQLTPVDTKSVKMNKVVQTNKFLLSCDVHILRRISDNTNFYGPFEFVLTGVCCILSPAFITWKSREFPETRAQMFRVLAAFESLECPQQ